MSVLLKCDICGKAEGTRGIKFDSRPLMLQIKNHKRQPYNIFVSVDIEHAADTALKENLYKQHREANEKMLMEAYKNGATLQQSASAVAQPIQIEHAIQSKLKNPMPILCTKCKRIIAQYAVSYGADGELVAF